MDQRCLDNYVVCHRNATPGRNRVTITITEEKNGSKLQRLHERLTECGLFEHTEQLYFYDEGKILYGFETDASLGSDDFKRARDLFLTEVKKEIFKYPIYCQFPKVELTVVK